MAIQVIILAAGAGTRMHSAYPKIMHHLGGKPLLEHVMTKALSLSPDTPPIVIYGHQGEVVKNAFDHYHLRWVRQKEQLGTGHAVREALPFLSNEDQVLILYGDVPLVSPLTLQRLLALTKENKVGLITAQLPHPKGYGRILRDQENKIIGIIEEKDASDKERLITEINSGVYALPAFFLKKWLPTLSNQNAQEEYYLTDVIAQAVKEGIDIESVPAIFIEEILGVNDRVQLAELERFYQRQQAETLMRKGVTIYDPNRLDIRGDVRIGRDTTIDVNVILEGDIHIGEGCIIGPHCILRNVMLGDRVEIKANTIMDGVEVGDECIIGPFARLRPGTVLSKCVHVGNFVELKNSAVHEMSKINHLSYIGDSEIGKRVNVGAGTITCNYDGVNKHQTIIGDDVFIGSDTQLIAPVIIGSGATIGAGSTIVKNVPEHQLTLTQRIEQRIMGGWQRSKKKVTNESTS